MPLITDSRSARGPAARLAPLAAITAITAGSETLAQDPSFTYHYAVAGEFADSIDFGGVPINRDVIVFYEHTLGLFPRIDLRTGEHLNGGIPHLGDFSEHIGICLNDIIEAIPDPAWDGFVVIDYESWTPWWDDTTQRYRDATIDDIRRRYPEWTDADIEAFAREIYELSARRFLEGTIKLGQALRPNARWGFWAYPKARHADLDNSDTQWLWDASDVFFPEIYMQDYLVPDNVEPMLGEANYSDYINTAFNGNLAYARQLAGDTKPTLAFAWPRYGHRNENQWYRLQFLEPEHLQLMLAGPYFWDADGVVIWDHLPQQGLADVFQEYFDNAIGPEIQRMTEYVIEQDRLEEENRIREDVNNDGLVNTADLSYVLWTIGTDDPDADVNDDGIVDFLDATMVILAFTN